jgi:prepilin-type N-terminal cleavage/methylation domain-containing protein
MSSLRARLGIASDQRGYTLIELVVGMALGVIVMLAAFGLLEFTTEDVSRTTTRVQLNQLGRTALENVMLELHSACVAPNVNPIIEKTSPTTLILVSQAGQESTFATVHKRKIVYTAGANGTGTLIEYIYPSTSAINSAGNYTFSSTAEKTVLLLKGIRQTEEVGKPGVYRPVFQYYRYYEKTDTSPKYGQIDETAISGGTGGELSLAEAENVTKVTMSFTLAPEGKEAATFGHDRPVAFEDSAVFRLASPSEATGNTNPPCAPQT